MKKLLITLGIVISLSFSQLDFEAIWSRGYVDGWCYEQEICLKPILPIPPQQRLKDTTERIIYNRGFLKGLNDYKNR